MASTMARLRRSSGGKAFEMTLEMALDLPLGFGHEPQAGAIAEQSGEGADPE